MDSKERLEKVKRALLSIQRYNWEQGVAAQAFLEAGDTEMAVLMAKEAVLRQDAEGRLAMNGGGTVTDPAANGEAVFYAAKATGDSKLKEASDKMLNWLLNKAPKTEDGILYHITQGRQVWVDSFYMAPPFLAVAGHLDEAVKQVEGFRKILLNAEKKLYSHIWDEDRNAFKREALWGVGNGWAAAGITRIIALLPEEKVKEKQRLAGYVKEIIDACLTYQRADGLFHDVVDDPSTFVETNLAQMLSYSIYRGVHGGWLDKSYLQHADRMREAVYTKVDEYGLVQGVCGAPHFDKPGTAAEGQAFFILMETAAGQLGK